MHDDCVIALALAAWQVAQHSPIEGTGRVFRRRRETGLWWPVSSWF
jgi:hypothetical protein